MNSLKGIDPKQVNNNIQTALSLWDLSSRNGNSTALLRLGILYYNGTYVQQNLVKAALLFKQSAELGNPRGMESYAYCLFNGIGIHQDIDLANKYYQASIKKSSY